LESSSDAASVEARAIGCIAAVASTLIFGGAADAVPFAVFVGTNNDPTGGATVPFVQSEGLTSQTFQQIYSASAFPTGTLFSIYQIEFFPNRSLSPTGVFATTAGNFNIALSTTSTAVNGLSTTFANNLGADNTTVFNASLPMGTALDNRLFILFSSPFLYDPSKGNLLMTVISTNVPLNAPGVGGLLAEDPSTIMSDVFNGQTPDGGDFVAGSAVGLLTQFDYNPVAPATPLPAALPLFATGLGAMGLIGWRRKRKARAVA